MNELPTLPKILLTYKTITIPFCQHFVARVILILLDLWDFYPNTCQSDDFSPFSSKAEALLYLLLNSPRQMITSLMILLIISSVTIF